MNIKKRLIILWDRYFQNFRQSFKKHLTKKKEIEKNELTAIIETLDQQYAKVGSERQDLWFEIKEKYTDWLDSQGNELYQKVAVEEFDCAVILVQINFYRELGRLLAQIS